MHEPVPQREAAALPVGPPPGARPRLDEEVRKRRAKEAAEAAAEARLGYCDWCMEAYAVVRYGSVAACEKHIHDCWDIVLGPTRAKIAAWRQRK